LPGCRFLAVDIDTAKNTGPLGTMMHGLSLEAAASRNLTRRGMPHFIVIYIAGLAHGII
jgi:hypothetical protein